MIREVDFDRGSSLGGEDDEEAIVVFIGSALHLLLATLYFNL